MGPDVGALVEWGRAMLDEARSAADALASPAVALGLLIGAAARSGRDKLTLLLPEGLEAFGLWVEQLIAESTGKHGTGVLPVAGEAPGAPNVYGSDRLFVSLQLAGTPSPDAATALAAAGHPVAAIDMPQRLALGAEFMRWEIATSVAGALLGINPFDEPNVQQAKDATGALLAEFRKNGRLPEAPTAIQRPDGVTLTRSAAASGAGEPLPALLAQLVAGDYLAILAYLGPDRAMTDVIGRFRAEVRDRRRVATTFGFGPRYLHSTGQLHKGGPNTGVFVMVTAAPESDLAVPGQPYTFGTLEHAQALGDFASLDAAGRRALHIHLPRPDASLLARVLETR
jgi:hypothetical protein